MSEKPEKQLFKRGSTTHYWSAGLLPKKYRHDVFALYSFVRTAVDYATEPPLQPKKLLALEKAYQKAIADPAFEVIPHTWDDIDTRVIKNIVRLSHKYKFEQAWVEAFFWSMKQDIDPSSYKSLDDCLRYVYGSAEVIGLMMAKIAGLPEETYEAARAQGRAMQWLNFIRDIEEDSQLGRLYFPREDLKKYHLNDLSRETAESQAADFERFVHYQIKRYRKWQAEADDGVQDMPLRLKNALKTAVEMYDWTAKKIEQDPLIVFNRKIRPKKIRVLFSQTKRVAKHAGKLLTQQDQIVTKK